MRRGRTERSVHGTMSRTAGPSGFARRANRPEKVPLAKTPCGWLHLVSGTAAPGIGAGATRLAVWRELCSGGHQPATLYRRRLAGCCATAAAIRTQKPPAGRRRYTQVLILFGGLGPRGGRVVALQPLLYRV